MPADRETIQRAQQGDRGAFVDIVDQHYDFIFHLALKYVGVKEDAEDITQQACIKLAKNLQQFRFESAFSTWLYRLVINCAKDWLKSQKRHRTIDDSNLDLAADEQNQNKQEQGVYLQQVLAHIERMGEGYRDVVVLTVGEGLSHQEAAEVLAIKESTVSWRLHEVRKRLSQLAQTEGSK